MQVDISNYSGIRPGKNDLPIVGGVQSEKDLIVMPMRDWDMYRPNHENQNLGYETSACLIFSGFDCLETKLNYLWTKGVISDDIKKWMIDNKYFIDGSFNFSDRFAALHANIIPLTGTYQWEAANSVCKYHLPESVLPYTPIGEYKNPDNTPGGYYNPQVVTPEMMVLSEEFNKRISITWYYVEDEMDELQRNPIQGIVRFANGDGILKPEGKLNHGIMVYNAVDNIRYIDDSYTQRDKRYDKNYVFDYIAFKISINNNNMDTAKFIRDNDLKWVRNEKTGQFGRIMQNKLRVIESTDRGACILLDDKIRNNKIIRDGKESSSTLTVFEWDSLPKDNF